MAESVTFDYRRGRALGVGVGGSLALTTVSVLLAVIAAGPQAPGPLQLFAGTSIFERTLLLVIGTVGGLTFGLFAVLSFLMLVRRNASLVVDSAGFTDTSSMIGAGRVGWEQVTGWHVSAGTNLCVLVADPGSILSRMSPFQRLISRGNVKLVGTPVCIGLSNVSGEPDQVLNAFTEHHQRWSEARHRPI